MVFTCSVLFGEELMGRLAHCIEACPTVRAVATFQPFPASRGGLCGFVEGAAEMCGVSWDIGNHSCPLLTGAGPCTAKAHPGSAVHVYLRTGPHLVEPGKRELTARAAGLALAWERGSSQWVFI